MSLSQQLMIKKTLSQAKIAIRNGDSALALKLYNSVLKHKPNHPIARKGISKLHKALTRNQSVKVQPVDPPQDQIDTLINMYYSGQMSKTEQACQELLQTYPKSLVILNLQGASFYRQGKLREAVKIYNKAIRIKPHYAEAYSNRGAALKDLGQLNKAVESYNKAIQIKPDYAEAYSNRGNAFKDLGQLNKAVESYNKAIRIKPDYAEAYSNRGNAFKKLGQLKHAVESYNKAIRIKPGHAEFYYNRGNAFKDLRQLKQAVESYDKAIRIKRDYAEAHYNLGNAFKKLGQLKEAFENYNKAIRIKPDYAEAYSNRGNAFKELGQLKEALNDYNKAIRIKPDYAKAYSNRGVAFQELGQLQEAFENYNKAIRIKSDYAEAYYNLSSIKKYKPDDTQIGIMKNLFECSERSETDRRHFSFALAKAYDDIGEYDKSFDYLKEGNRLRKKELNYNIDNDRRLFARIKEVFRAGNLAPDVVPDRNRQIQPIFILGMPRSGTSLVEQILASHTKVHGAGELNIMFNLVNSILSDLPDQNPNQGGREWQDKLTTLGDAYLKVLQALNVPEKIITDKMPLNFIYVGFILSALPEAKILHLNRDPRATCWSIYKQSFSSHGNGYAYDMNDLAEFFKLY
ncbi:MAG: tetratricopeptide repeat protein, partial [Desulfobulbaceae bacterium]|nr:tetratricopeptide repeat protein [Desulfobulbaceae bacterium]